AAIPVALMSTARPANSPSRIVISRGGALDSQPHAFWPFPRRVQQDHRTPDLGCAASAFRSPPAQSIRGVVITVVTRAMQTIIENNTGERMPLSRRSEERRVG